MPHVRDSSVAIGPVRVESAGAGTRVSAAVDGVPVWFETPDLALAPAPEAFASALLIPSLRHRLPLRVEDPLDPLWRKHAAEIAALVWPWWGYRATPPVPAVAGRGDASADPPGDSTALFFSGGVDSFHELLRGGHGVERLVTLHGFDYPLEDVVRGAAVESSVRALAAALGLRVALVRTNVRAHPLVVRTPWERAYGGVLGGVAHLLRHDSRRVILAASAPSDREVPWGSHWRLDPLWSSSTTTVAHGGRGLRRVDKLRAIAGEPLVAEYLRVCWRNRAPTGNCSRCAKCVLAMLVLEDCGTLARSRVFDGRDQLAARIDGVRRTPDRIQEFDELSRSPCLPPAVTDAARRLVRRSRHALRLDVRLRRAIVGWIVTRLRSSPPRPGS